MNSSVYRRALAGLFFVSGFTLLLHLMVDAKRLSLQFGVSASTIATAATIFIGGWGFGGWLAGRVSGRIRKPIRFYAGTQAAAAILGLLSWPLFQSLSPLIAPFYGVPFLFPALRAACLLVFLFPAMLMCAVLPMLVLGDANRDSLVRTVGFFYGFYAAGLALAALVGGFLFLSFLGVGLTAGLTAFLEFGIAGAALFVAHHAPVVSAETDQPLVDASSAGNFSIKLLAMVFGFCAFSLEIAWMRGLVPFLGPSIYAHFLLLSVYLGGMGAVGFLISKYISPRERWPMHADSDGALLGRLSAWGACGALAGYFLMTFIFLQKIDPRGDLLFLEVGASNTVAVSRTADQTTLKIDGRIAASTGGERATQLLLGHLPMMFVPHPKRVCVIGYGGGAAVRAVVAHAPRWVDVVEAEPAVIEASPYFRSVNDAVLDDPGVHVHIDDGRSFLFYTKGTFDVIVSNAPSPWVAGAGGLFSREFYQRVKSRLSDGGVFCQWIQTREMSRPTLNVMIQTLAETFPNFSIFVVGSDFICVASNAPLSSTWAELSRRMSVPEVKRSLADIGVENPFDLLIGYYASFPEDAEHYRTWIRNTDDNGWLEAHAPFDKYSGRLPQLDRPSIPVGFERYALRFFSDLSKDQIALGLASSIARLRPFASFRIDDMIPLFEKSDTIAHLKNFARTAATRADVLRSVDDTMNEAAQKIRQGHFDEAQKQLVPLIAVDPHQPGLQRLLGIAATRAKQTDSAVAYFSAALRDNPSDFETLTELGEIRLAEANVPAAIACFSRALEANPHAPRARALQAQLLNGKK